MKILEYNWESSYDLEQDVNEAIVEMVEEHGGEWPGTIKITIEYDPNDE